MLVSLLRTTDCKVNALPNKTVQTSFASFYSRPSSLFGTNIQIYFEALELDAPPVGVTRSDDTIDLLILLWALEWSVAAEEMNKSEHTSHLNSLLCSILRVGGKKVRPGQDSKQERGNCSQQHDAINGNVLLQQWLDPPAPNPLPSVRESTSNYDITGDITTN